MMIIRGVNVFPTQIEEILLKIEKLSPHYQLEITRDGNLDHLTVNVEARSNQVSEAERAAAAKELQHRIKVLVGVSTKINIKSEGEIARSQGKAQRVVDKRPK